MVRLLRELDELDPLSRTRPFSINSGNNPFANYAGYITATIDSSVIDGNQTDLPVTLVISAASGIGDVDLSAVVSELASNANRLKVALAIGSSEVQCYMVCQKADFANGLFIYRARIPSVLAASDTVLRFYYGRDALSNTLYVGDRGTAPAQKVWASKYKGVFCLDEATGATVLDSTRNGNNGTPVSDPATNTSGVIASCLTFDGSADYVKFPVGTVTDFNLAPHTEGDAWAIECWMATTASGAVIAKCTGTYRQYQLYTNGSTLQGRVGSTNDSNLAGTHNDGEWHHVMLRKLTDNTCRVYGNGVEGSSANTGTAVAPVDPLIGGRRNAEEGQEHFNDDATYLLTGKVDELRVISGDPGAYYAKAIYNDGIDNLITYS